MGDLTAPRREVMATLGRRLDDGTPAVLATIVGVEGSAYRRAGAKTVVTPSTDETVGAITASCLVDEVQSLAQRVLAAGGPRVKQFDLTGDVDEDQWGLGMGCNGVIDVLLEPIDTNLAPVVAGFDDGDPVTIATIVGGTDDRVAVGDRAVFGIEGIETPSPVVSEMPIDLRETLEEVVSEWTSGSAVVDRDTSDGSVAVFVDRIDPLPRLVVVGTGQDVRPVVDLATNVDFRVIVAGFRGATTTDHRFPAADRVVATSPSRITEDVPMDDDTYVVLMTHNFVDDRLALEAILTTPVEYVGLMGPTDRFEDMCDALADEGRGLSSDDRSRVYTPVGLDIGADTPYQVAHSIVGEALAVHNDRAGGHLRGLGGPIHDRTTVHIQRRD